MYSQLFLEISNVQSQKSQRCVKKSLFLLFAAEGINLAQSKKSCEEL